MARIIVYPDELYHYGRLGMKWGKHIYGSDKSKSSGNAARPAGKATPKTASTANAAKPAGKATTKSASAPDGQPKKTAKEKAAELAANVKAKASKTFKDPAPVTDQFNGKSNDDIKAMKQRYENQLAVVRAQAELSKIQQANISPAKQFAKNFMEKVAYPAIKDGMTDAVKSYTKEQIKQAVFGEVEDPLPAIKRSLELTEAKAKMAEAQIRYAEAQDKIAARNRIIDEKKAKAAK